MLIKRYNECGPDLLGDQRVHDGTEPTVLTPEALAALKERLQTVVWQLGYTHMGVDASTHSIGRAAYFLPPMTITANAPTVTPHVTRRHFWRCMKTARERAS
jgi:hypothetical protein